MELLYPAIERTDAETLVALLAARGVTVAFAESCTAGLCAAGIAAVAGASAVMAASFVTYANEAKCALLGVHPDTLAAHGAVSAEVAAEMAAGAAFAANAELGVGISGIAGPGGGSAEKPIGTVAFGFSFFGRVESTVCHFPDNGRAGVRAAAVAFAYRTLIERLTEQE